MMQALKQMAMRLAVLLIALPVFVAPGRATEPGISAAPALTRAQAQSALQALQDPAKRAALENLLKLMAAGQSVPDAQAAAPMVLAADNTVAPAPASPAADQGQAADTPPAQAGQTTPPSDAKAPAAPPAKQAAADTPKPAVRLTPDSLGAQLLVQAERSTGEVVSQISSALRAVNDFPLLWRWMRRVAASEEDRAALLDASWKLALVLFLGLGAQRAAIRLVRPGIQALEDRAPPLEAQLDPPPAAPEVVEEAGPLPEHRSERPSAHETRHPKPKPLNAAWRMLRRLPYVLGRLVLEWLPLAAFGAIAFIMLGSGLVESDTTRLVIVYVASGYIVCRAAVLATKALLSPGRPRLRLLHASDETAAYTVIWVRRLAIVAALGYTLAEIGLLFGMYQTAHDALLKLFALIDHLFAVVIVLQCRQSVAARIRPPKERRGVVATLLRRLASVWHLIAIFYIMALWLVWAAEVEDGFSRLFRFFVTTTVILLVGRLLGIVALGGLERAFHINPELSARYPGLEARANRYFPLLRSSVSALVFAITIVSLLQAWGLGAWTWFLTNSLGARVVDALVTVGIAILLAILAWEGMNAGLERQLSNLTRDQQMVKAARLRTLMPILRTALLITILLIVGLTVLSEIGVNIAPLLAGAGILGVAIGFGSQKLVQDFITGIFLLLENAMQVGDWVTVAGLSGSVETLSIRTLRLRAGDGSIHIIPFSSVSTVTNTNRGIGNAAVSVDIAAHHDTDEVGELLKDVAKQMRGEMPYKLMMRSDLQLWGVDKVSGESVTIAGQIVCTDAGRWGVQREFNRRMKKKFEECGIELAVPIQTIFMRQSLPSPKPRVLDGAAEGDPGPTTATIKQSPPPQALGNMS